MGRRIQDLALGCIIFGAPVVAVVGAAVWVMPLLPNLVVRVLAGAALLFVLAVLWGVVFTKVPLTGISVTHRAPSPRK
jgi:hypothetical protein